MNVSRDVNNLHVIQVAGQTFLTSISADQNVTNGNSTQFQLAGSLFSNEGILTAIVPHNHETVDGTRNIDMLDGKNGHSKIDTIDNDGVGTNIGVVISNFFPVAPLNTVVSQATDTDIESSSTWTQSLLLIFGSTISPIMTNFQA